MQMKQMTLTKNRAATLGVGQYLRHLLWLNVKAGQEVKRGDVIGYVGNTGLSAGPHLHYEVRKDGEAVNPANFYFNDLSPEEYELMIQISSTAGQSLD